MKLNNIEKLLAAALLFTSSLAAHALVIDFESTGTAGTYNALDYSIDGYVFNATLDNMDLSPAAPWSGSGPAHSGRFAALNNHGGNGVISKVGGGAFSFESLWLKGWNNSSQAATVTGRFNGAVVASVTGNIGGAWSEFGGNFSQIDQLSISSASFFLLDDISLGAVSAIPEPQSYALLLAGLGLMGATIQRRKI